MHNNAYMCNTRSLFSNTNSTNEIGHYKRSIYKANNSYYLLLKMNRKIVHGYCL